ncbi:hypothetical protein ECDEC5B_2660 [Escherichia coli DEC5B]|nr:hypothetical protein ECDEC5B_2660 [Escherichia coli DEC5B]
MHRQHNKKASAHSEGRWLKRVDVLHMILIFGSTFSDRQ